jgi:hypothetical protein
MTYSTDRDDIQRFRIVRMMVLFCVFSTICALELFNRFQFSCSNCITNNTISVPSFWMSFVVKTSCFSIYFFPFFTLMIFLTTYFIFFNMFKVMQFAANFMTGLALILQSSALRFVFVKFRLGFNLFAFRTGFCYNRVRHNLLQYSKFCLESVRDYISLIDSFYYTPMNFKYNKNLG